MAFSVQENARAGCDEKTANQRGIITETGIFYNDDAIIPASPFLCACRVFFLQGVEDLMTITLSHTFTNTDRDHRVHTYLVDLGYEIDIHQVMEYRHDVFESIVLGPPYLRTRFFEITITESKKRTGSRINDLEVYPVTVKKNPDLRIWGFCIRPGKWMITGRLFRKGATTAIQWVYTDDFNLFAITQTQDEPERVAGQIIQKIEDIALSIKAQSPIVSHAENQQMNRDAFNTFLEKQRGIERLTSPVTSDDDHDTGTHWQMQEDILKDFVVRGSRLDSFGGPAACKANISIPKNADITPQTAGIDDLDDISWLFE
jgi:hypothetical protein